MPDEPNRSAEEQLKAWAQQRREETGAPMELHPATRKLLQDEVARTFPKKPAEPAAPSGGWWEMLWPRFGLAGSICALLVILTGLFLPALSKSKSKAQQISAASQLKIIGLSARVYAVDHEGKLPANYQQMRDELGGASAEKLTKDPESGQEFVYLGAGKLEGDSGAVLAYSPTEHLGGRAVLFSDGRVDRMTEARFQDVLKRTEKGVTTVALATQPASVPALAENKPAEQEVLARTDSKDTRLKEIVQTSKVPPGKESEQKGQLELASTDKAKQAVSPAAGTATVGRESNVEIARNEAVMRERYGLLPAQGGGVASRVDAANEKQRASSVAKAPLARKPQSTPETANGPQGAGGFGGATAATGAPALNGRVPPVDGQSEVATGKPLGLALEDRVATDRLDLAGHPRDAGKPGNSNALAYYADASATQSGQRYAQVRRYRVNFNSPPMPNVLRSFQVEQTGRQIRVVDADGSVYEGAIGQPASEEVLKHSVVAQTGDTELKKNLEPGLGRTEIAPAPTAGETAEQQNTYFRVAGTNRSLNQLVVFQGNFLANTNQTNAVLLGSKLEAERSFVPQRQNRSLQSQQPFNASIQGQATIGGRNRIQINASPVP